MVFLCRTIIDLGLVLGGDWRWPWCRCSIERSTETSDLWRSTERIRSDRTVCNNYWSLWNLFQQWVFNIYSQSDLHEFVLPWSWRRQRLIFIVFRVASEWRTRTWNQRHSWTRHSGTFDDGWLIFMRDWHQRNFLSFHFSWKVESKRFTLILKQWLIIKPIVVSLRLLIVLKPKTYTNVFNSGH